MTLTTLEGALNALRDYLQDNLGTTITSLNTRYTDDTLEEPRTWYIGNMPQANPELTSICLVGTSMVPGLQQRSQIEVINELSIIVFVGHNDLEVRFRRLCRYALGIMELLQAGESTMGYIVKLGGAIAVTDTMNTQPFLQGIIIPVTMAKIEQY